MTEVVFRSDMGVEMVSVMGNDIRIAQAARVSTQGMNEPGAGIDGLINFLMRERHGSPFEHLVFTWAITAPIFVAREFMRHRMASYNEESGRYKQLSPVFYIPAEDRPLVQVGKAGAYTFEPGDLEQYEATKEAISVVSGVAYGAYQGMLNKGIAREVARMVLPLNIYTSFYVTMNARALMNFLSLRTSLGGSHPQYEIEEVAKDMEQDFATWAPLTWAAFCEHGRTAP